MRQNPTAWNLRGKIGFVWGPICFLCFIWAYFRLPEMKVRSPLSCTEERWNQILMFPP